jgi:ABC-type multidrug transport system fused ATPase/permease subunit
MTPGNLTTFLIYTLSVVTGVGLITSIFTDLMKAVGASRRIFFLLDRKPLVRFDGGRNDVKIKGKIQFSNVTFSYPSRPTEIVLQGFNLDIEPGKVVALVGHSGGGKTTIAKLLAGFYYPSSGEITVDGVDIHSLEPSYWRQNIGIVSQEPTLFAISIKDNIAYSSPDSQFSSPEEKMARIKKVSKMANADEFIDDLKEKYETLVGERGVRLSGGQKQRVAIARALMRDPRILVFDEATSALDSESEYKVQSALDELITHREGRSVLVIAHRLSTVKNADEVVVIDHGRVVERGKNEELMLKGGVYRELVSRQLETSKN